MASLSVGVGLTWLAGRRSARRTQEPSHFMIPRRAACGSARTLPLAATERLPSPRDCTPPARAAGRELPQRGERRGGPVGGLCGLDAGADEGGHAVVAGDALGDAFDGRRVPLSGQPCGELGDGSAEVVEPVLGLHSAFGQPVVHQRRRSASPSLPATLTIAAARPVLPPGLDQSAS